MRELRHGDDGIDADDEQDDPLPAGTEAVVCIHRELRATGGFEAEYPEGEAPDAVAYEVGDEVPLAVARRAWAGHSDRLACLDDAGERLDRPGRGEANGDVDAEPALAAWRRENNLRRTTVEVFECGECGATFESRQALNGHQSKHAENNGRPPDGALTPETMAGRLDGDAAGDADADPEADGDDESTGDAEGAEAATEVQP